MKTQILYAEDDVRMRRLLRDFIEREGYELIEVENGTEAVRIFNQNKDISLVILDIMMPELNGWEVCKEIRKSSLVPILMLTAKGEEYDELYGFQIGADDYITKPFSPLLLMARIKALLKRAKKLVDAEQKEEWEEAGLKISFYSNKVWVDKELVELSPKEYALLESFIRSEGKVLTREFLLNHVWGYDYFGDSRTVDTHINRLRLKLGVYESWIHTIRGKGYRFEVAYV